MDHTTRTSLAIFRKFFFDILGGDCKIVLRSFNAFILLAHVKAIDR